jgi:hypothetical protein
MKKTRLFYFTIIIPEHGQVFVPGCGSGHPNIKARVISFNRIYKRFFFFTFVFLATKDGHVTGMGMGFDLWVRKEKKEKEKEGYQTIYFNARARLLCGITQQLKSGESAKT